MASSTDIYGAITNDDQVSDQTFFVISLTPDEGGPTELDKQ